MPIMKVKVCHNVPKIRRCVTDDDGNVTYYDKDDNVIPESELGKMEEVTEWVPFYVDSLNNRLRSDRNLGDLENRNAALENLSLTGNVTTHSHEVYDSGIADLSERLTQTERELRASLQDAVLAINSGDATKQYELNVIRQGVHDLVNTESAALRQAIQTECDSRARQYAYLQGLIDRERSERLLAVESEELRRKADNEEQNADIVTKYEELKKSISDLTDALEKLRTETRSRIDGVENDMPQSIKDEVAREVLPVGVVIAWPSSKAFPEDFLECNGQSVSAVEYPVLASIMGNTPDMRNVFLQGSETPGRMVAAGLPNLQGYLYAFEGIESSEVQLDGNLFSEGIGAHSSDTSIGTSDERCKRIEFNASNANSVYGASDTVQPPAYTVKWIIKAR